MPRKLYIPQNTEQIFYQDQWRPEYEPEHTFFSAAFKDVIFKREEKENVESVEKNRMKDNGE